MDEFSLLPCNIETNEVPSTIISLATFGKLNIPYVQQNVISRSLCNEKGNLIAIFDSSKKARFPSLLQ